MLAFIFNFSIKNVFRNQIQTLISLLAICSSVVILLFFRGFIDFTLEGLKANTISEIGHVQIGKKSHFELGGDIVNSTSNQLNAKEYQSILQSISGINYIKAVSPRLNGSGIIALNNTSLYVKLTGVNPKQDEEFSSAETIINGRQVRNSDECIIGNSLYQALGAKLLQELTLLSTTEYGGINAVTCKLVGIVETRSRDLDKVYTKLHIKNLKRLFDTDKLNYVMVLLDSDKQIETFTNKLKNKLTENIYYRTWEDLAEYYKSVKSLYESIFNIATLSLVFIMILSILNTISMSIFDRHNEIGMLRAIGMSKQQIFSHLFIEGTVLGLLGAFFGTLIGVGIISYINYLGGISMPPAPGMTSGYDVIIKVSPYSVKLAFIMSISSAIFATFYPAHKATQKEIVFSINKR